MRFDTTPLEYLDMAALAYQESNWKKSTQHRQLLTLGWRPLTPPKSSCFLRKGRGGYRGIVYVHDKRKEIVCAHRGTASLAAIEADITLLIEQKIHAQVTEAIEICLDNVVKKLLSDGFFLTFTGHSLGGFLATSCLYFCQRTDLVNSRGDSLHYPRSKAVVFDPAGSQTFLSTLEPNAISHGGLGKKGIKNLNILHFVSLPNYINAYAPHPGGTLYSLLPNHIIFETMNAAAYLKQTHCLSNLKKCFITLDSSDPCAGYPKKNQCQKMSDWPLINLEELTNLGTVFGALSAPLKLGIDTLQTLATMVGHHSRRVLFLKRLGGGEKYRQALSLAIEAVKTGEAIKAPELRATLSSHYMTKNLSYDVQLHKLHFGKALSAFLIDYTAHLQNTTQETLFIQEHKLTKEDSQLLANYRINSFGEFFLVVPNTSIFIFRRKVAKLFLENKLKPTSVRSWLKRKMANLPHELENMENRLAALENSLNKQTDYSANASYSFSNLIIQYASSRYQHPVTKKKRSPAVVSSKQVIRH